VGEYVTGGLFGIVMISGLVMVVIRLKSGGYKSSEALPTFFPKKSPPSLPKPPPVPLIYQALNPRESGGHPVVQSPIPAIHQALNPPLVDPNTPDSPPPDHLVPKKSKKGCLIAIGCLVAIFCLAIGGCWVLAQQYEKRPKKPGEAEIFHAEEFIRSFKTEEFDGNTPEAKAMAKDFARLLRVARETAVTASKPELVDYTKGRFLTYCCLKGDSAAFIVHVPGLSNFRPEAKLTLEETAWTLATGLIDRDQPNLKRMALGIKGNMDYSSIVTGTVEAKEPLEGIETRHPLITTKPLWPYFATNGSPPIKP